MTFACWVFRIAGVVGLLILLPMYFMEEQIGKEQPPAITHPENYYGFIGVSAVWQLVYLLIGHDPVRYRPMMPLAFLAKSSFGVAVWVLFAQGRVAWQILPFASMDLAFGLLFLLAWWRCSRQPS
jgi:hypothetical protein